MPSTLDAPTIATRFAQAGAGSAQAEVLRQAFDERDRALDAHAHTLHVLQEAVQKLQEGQSRRDLRQATSQADASVPGHQVKTLEENIHRDAADRASKGDVALVRKDMETGFALIRKYMKAGFEQCRAEVATLRRDMEVGFAWR